MLFLPKRNILFSLLSVVHPEDHLKTYYSRFTAVVLHSTLALFFCCERIPFALKYWAAEAEKKVFPFG